LASDFAQSLIALLPRLRRFGLALTGTADADDDLVQSACERALRDRDGFVPGTRLDSWMFPITQNLWIDCRRQHGPFMAGTESMPSSFEVTDLMLMQLADGELDSDNAQRVRDALADDPDMRERFAKFGATRATTQQAFDAVLRAPVPAGLIQSVLAADLQTATRPRHKAARLSGWLDWLRPANASGYAGWAVAGAALAVLALPPTSPTDIKLGQAGPALASVLETRPSGLAGREGGLSLVALATHPARGTHCRDFAADRSEGQTLGVACR
jgi:DNA-directed RNA polymerase specialized sigma24 family protein